MKTDGLTELEIKVLQAARKTDYGDCLEGGQWSFAVCDAADLDPKVYRGVVSSLIKKGLVTIWDDEPVKSQIMDLNRESMVFDYTDAGKLLFQ
jgi:hypothetical protein